MGLCRVGPCFYQDGKDYKFGLIQACLYYVVLKEIFWQEYHKTNGDISPFLRVKKTKFLNIGNLLCFLGAENINKVQDILSGF